MAYWKSGLISCLLTFFLACGDKYPTRDFSIILADGNSKIPYSETIPVHIQNRSGVAEDSVTFFMDGNQVQVRDGELLLPNVRLGNKSLEAVVYIDGARIRVDKEFSLLAPGEPTIYDYEIVNTYPHDIDAFTQGLEFRGDILYESTGQKGESSLRKVDFTTGEILEQHNLPNQYFGEGITLLGDTLYMLTWQSRTGFLFNPKTLEQIGSFQYGTSREGWGLCNDGNRLFKSDGSEKIWLLDPGNLSEVGHIETVTNKSVFNKANELEYVDGKIYANVWQRPSVMIIDADSGAIEGVVNFGGLEKQVTQHDRLDVLNGIAYHRERGTFFITGKRWDRLFEVRIVSRER